MSSEGDKRAALLFDTGTGQTRLLLCAQRRLPGESERTIYSRELAAVVVDLDNMGVSSMADLAVQAVSDTEAALRLRNKFLDPLVYGVRSMVDTAEFTDMTIVAATLGVSAWYRHLEGHKLAAAQQFLSLVRQVLNTALMRLGVSCELRIHELSGLDEARYEAAAVTYALEANELAAPMINMSGGKGSIQLTGFDTSFSFDSILNDGASMVENAAPDDHQRSIEAWQDQTATSFLAASGAPSLIAGARGALAKRDDSSAMCGVVITGAFYYAAVNAKVVDRKARAYVYQPAIDVVERLTAVTAAGPPKAADPKAMTDGEQKKLRQYYTEVANTARLITCLKQVFGEHLDSAAAQCLFARDWLVNGQDFRTTWTTGWWIKHLEENRLQQGSETTIAEKLHDFTSPIGALLIDTGTGETKLIAVTERADNPAFIELTEFGIVKQPTMEVATALQRGGAEGAAAFEAFCAPLVNGLQQFAATDSLDKVSVVGAVIGVTAWIRQLRNGEEMKAANAFLKQLTERMTVEFRKIGRLNTVEPRVLELSGQSEAEYELRAVGYAVAHSELPPPLATLAGGSGSVQVTGLDSYVSFAAALKVGGKMVQSPGGVSEWQRTVAEEFKAATSASSRLLKQIERASQDGTVANIVLISAFFYAAVAAKIVDRKSEEYKYLPAEEVIGKLQALVDSTPPAAADAEAPTEAEKKKLDAHHKDVANASRLITCLTSLFGANLANVRCLFARDWTINGSKFRTTWTAGWFLEKQAQIDVR